MKKHKKAARMLKHIEKLHLLLTRINTTYDELIGMARIMSVDPTPENDPHGVVTKLQAETRVRLDKNKMSFKYSKQSGLYLVHNKTYYRLQHRTL